MVSMRKIETPIAEMSDDNGAAPRARSRRYATNSTRTARTAQAIIEPTSAMTSVYTSSKPASGFAVTGWSSSSISTQRTAKVPSINTSEFAKLMSLSTP